jgi:hypothetical protein
MNWIGLFAAMAVVAIIFSVVTDVEMTECQRGSVYAIVHFFANPTSRRIAHLIAGLIRTGVNESLLYR